MHACIYIKPTSVAVGYLDFASPNFTFRCLSVSCLYVCLFNVNKNVGLSMQIEKTDRQTDKSVCQMTDWKDRQTDRFVCQLSD